MFRQRAACFRHPLHLPPRLGPCLKIKITKRTHFGFPISYCTSAAYADLRPFESKKRTHFANGFWTLELGIWHPESCLSRGDSGLIGPIEYGGSKQNYFSARQDAHKTNTWCSRPKRLSSPNGGLRTKRSSNVYNNLWIHWCLSVVNKPLANPRKHPAILHPAESGQNTAIESLNTKTACIFTSL
jgi:hypothetical protein